MNGATLSVSLPIAGTTPGEGLDLARRASQWGYRGCWLSEVQGPDAFTQLGVLADSTDLELGVAVVPVQTRTAMMLGMSSVTLAQLSGGRFTLGIGASSELIVRDWAGQPFDAPLTHVRETVEALRPLLSGQRASYKGRYVEVNGYRPHATPDEPVPLFVGALGPKMLRLAGELADGVCLNQMGVEHVEEMLSHVAAGAEDAGRTLDGFGVVARLFCQVTDEPAEARETAKHIFSPYVATSVYAAHYRRLGFERQVDDVLAAAGDGDRPAMAAALSDDLVDTVFAIGDADHVVSRIEEYARAGVTVPVIAPISKDPTEVEETIRAVGEAWR